MEKKEEHIPIQREDGSIYCYCNVLPGEKCSMSVNWLTKKLMCTVCGKQINME